MLDMANYIGRLRLLPIPEHARGARKQSVLAIRTPCIESWNLLIPLICAGSYATRFSFLMILNMKSAATRQMHISVPHTM